MMGYTPVLQGLRASRGLSYLAIERISTDARARLVPHLGPRDPVNGLALVEELFNHQVDVRGEPYQLQFSVEEELKLPVEARCKFNSSDNMLWMELSLRTYLSLEGQNPRALFTVAHELGHLFMHGETLIRRPDQYHNSYDKPPAMERRRRVSHKVYEDTEFQANAFAAAFLMPAQGLTDLRYQKRRRVKITQQRFGVSQSAAMCRWKTIDERPELLEIGFV